MAAAKKTAEDVVSIDVPAEPTLEVKADADKTAAPVKKAETAESIVRERAKRNAERVRKGRPSTGTVVTYPKSRGAKTDDKKAR